MIGFIIAGGRSSRMGGKRKLLCPLGGKTILTRITSRLSSQTDQLILNVNDPEPELSKAGLTIIEDTLPGQLGPLAGLHSCLEHATLNFPNEEWILTAASDTPFLPLDLVASLNKAASDDVDVVIASSGGQDQRLTALWRTDLCKRLHDAITVHETRAAHRWLGRLKVAKVEFSESPFDPFFNINDAKDLIEGERLVTAHNL